MSKVSQISQLGAQAQIAEKDQLNLIAEVVVDAAKNGDKSCLLELIGAASQSRASAVDLLVAIQSKV